MSSIRKSKKVYKLFMKKCGIKIKKVPEFVSYIYWDWDKIVWKS